MALLAVLLTCCLLIIAHVEAEGVIASAAELRLLNEGEGNLTDILSKYIESERLRLEQLQQQLDRINEVRHRVNTSKSSGILGHPIDVYFLIQRFESEWTLINQLIFNTNASAAFNESLTALTPLLPNQADFDGARLAMVRLQSTYKLPIKDMLNGLVAGRQSQPLSQQDALLIALKAVNSSRADEAIEWLTAAFEHKQEPHVTDQQLHHALAKAYAEKEDFLAAVKHVQKAIELDPNTDLYLRDIVRSEKSVSQYDGDTKNVFDRYGAMCRDYITENLTVSAKGPADDQVCIALTSKNVPIQLIKLEYVSRQHEIVLYHDFITDRESEKLKAIAMQRLERSMVSGRGVTDIRVSKVSWLWNQNDTFVKKIDNRVADMTRLDVGSAEPLQMNNYGMGGHYVIHHDAFRYGLPLEISQLAPMGGDRIATFMIYLSDVEVGGATIFPEIDVGARPVKNAAIFWYNYNQTGLVDPDMVHGGCPVLIGEKWVANKWFHEYMHEFIRPCKPQSMNA